MLLDAEGRLTPTASRGILGLTTGAGATKAVAHSPSGWHVRRHDAGSTGFLGHHRDQLRLNNAVVFPHAINQALLSAPHVRDATVIALPHEATGSVLVALLHLDPAGDTRQVLAHARQFLPIGSAPTKAVLVQAVPRLPDGILDHHSARARTRHLTDPPSEHDTDQSSPDQPTSTRSELAWSDLIAFATTSRTYWKRRWSRYSTHRTPTPGLARTLGYDASPQPLTLLPILHPSQVDATPELAEYLNFAASASDHVLTALTRFGWPDPEQHGNQARYAAWILLQHADYANAARLELLHELRGALDAGLLDPRQFALLTDRARTVAGDPQQFGTFAVAHRGAAHFLYEAPAVEQLDRARSSIGLPSLAHDLAHLSGPILPRPALALPRPGASRLPTAIAPRSQNPDLLRAAPVPAGAAPIYLSASTERREELLQLREELTWPLHCTTRRLDLDPRTRPSSQFDAGVARERLSARLALRDLSRSRLLLALDDGHPDATTSREIGIALSLGLPVLRVGAADALYDYHPQVTHVADAATALQVARQWATR